MDERSVAIIDTIASELKEAARYSQAPWHNRDKKDDGVEKYHRFDQWAKWRQKPNSDA